MILEGKNLRWDLAVQEKGPKIAPGGKRGVKASRHHLYRRRTDRAGHITGKKIPLKMAETAFVRDKEGKEKKMQDNLLPKNAALRPT